MTSHKAARHPIGFFNQRVLTMTRCHLNRLLPIGTLEGFQHARSWASLFIAFLLSMAGHSHAAVPDLTAGGVPTDTSYINLGPTGMEGWIYNAGPGNMQETVDSRQILVTKVDAGSPAAGILAVGDIILGADGTGAEPVNFASDARKTLAYAIDDAEGNNPAVLKLIRWRSGMTTTVSITLESLGSYTATAPYNDPKSAAILEKGLNYIMNNVTGSGYGGFGATVLMAANNPSNPNNAARQARARTEALALNLSAQDIADMTSGDLSRAIGKPWNIGPQLITQAEYYLQTGDASVLPSIRARAIQICTGQSMFGTMGHSFSLPGPNGEINGPYGIGYGPVNNAGMPCFLGLILANKCGLNEQVILDGIARAGKYFQYYADLGTVPYGENKETGSIANNGKSGLAALALSMVNGYDTQAKYFTKLSVFGAKERDGGHTGPFFNQLWTPLASNLGGQDAMARYFNQTSWLYDLARRWDGGFVYHPYYQAGGISTDYGQGHQASWTTLLTYAAPLAQLHITGKNANPAVALNATDIADINHAISYNVASRTTAQLLQDLAHPLPQLHWSAGNEIGLRTADHASILPTLMNMAQNGATYAERHGAIYALGKIHDDTTASFLAGLCGDANSKVRYMAANALSNLSMAAKTAQAATIVNGLVTNDRPLLPLDPENPMHVEKMSFATLLFDSNVGIWGGSRVNTADRALLYPAFRIIAGAPMGVTVRDKAFSVAPYLTKTDVEQMADLLVDVACGPSPAENSYDSLAGAIEAMQVNGFAEGVPAAVAAYNNMPKNQGLVLDQLLNYAGSSLTVQPDPEVIELCKRIISNDDPYYFGTKYDGEAQAILDAIAADQLPEQLTPFKSIDWIFADQPALSLPATSTVLRVQSTDLAKGSSFYTWRKVHGAGNVSFTPNGTAAAKNTTVVFDGTPGVYTFGVTMADDKGLTEAYDTVTVTLNNSGGSLPPNTAPTATPAAIAAAQGTPTQVILAGTDPQGQALTFTVTDGPNHGHLSGTAPNITYTSDLAYTGADSITFEAMDTEGLKSTATVSITVSTTSAVGVAIYEPFAYPTGGFNGSSSVNEIGLDGIWNAQSGINVIGGSLNYGSLVTNGGALTASASANSHVATRAIKSSALAGNGLLNDGATLWFSAVLGHPAINNGANLYLALANDKFNNSSSNHYITNAGAQLGSGVGVWIEGSMVKAARFQDAAQSGPVAGTWTSQYGSIKSGVSRLVVGKITWGAAADTIEIYLPWDDLTLPSAPSSTLTANVNQSTYDTLTISRNGTPLIDEIRFGSTYQSVVQGTAAMVPDTMPPTPNPMTFASAPKPTSSSTISMTATPAFDLSSVEYYFTCTAGGAADSGWQQSNVYTATGLTPGVHYSFTVKARDKQPTGNQTTASAVASATIPALGTVPNLVGILQASAESLVTASNMSVGTITTASAYSLSVPAGHVLSQTPAADSSAAYGSSVNLVISIGQDPALPTLAATNIVDDKNGGPVVINTPMVFTLTFNEDINAATLQASDFTNVGTASVSIGTITETSPGVVTVGVTPTGIGILRFAVAAGATIKDAQGDDFNSTYAAIDDTVITIQLPPVTVPNVVGMVQATAESTIVAGNLVVGNIYQIYDGAVAVGNVISQSPLSGSSIPGQSPVSIVVSLGPPPDTTGPLLVSSVPADGAYNVEVNAEIELTFDEYVYTGTGNIIIRNLSDGTDTVIPVTDPAQCLAYTNSLTITPATPLQAGKSYALRVPAGAVVDASGNGFLGINDNSSMNFSTAVTPLVSVLFSENFEAPNVTAYTQGTTPTTWVKAAIGFNANKHGLTDKAGGDFSAADPNHQAYAFRYSNTGITTAEGLLATITQGVTYEVQFDSVRDDGGGAGTPFSVELRSFTAGQARNDCTGSGAGTTITTLTGNANANGTFTTHSFQYTVPAGSAHIGKDLALRFKGATVSANIDNVRVRTISPSAPDQVPPVIAALTPLDNAEQVSLVNNLKIVFDENINVGAGTITIKNLTTGAKTLINAIDATQVLLNGDTLEINPTADFNTNTFYSVQIAPGVITDMAGNAFAGITNDTFWTFNTGETDDAAAPAILATTPADGATGVSYSSNLTLTFDENVVVNSGNITLKNLTDATQMVIDVTDASQVTATGSTVTINPAAYLAEGKAYAVRMDSGTILDLSGNAFSGIANDTTWNFTTAGNNPPAIASLSPADEAVNIDIASNLSVTFDEPIAAGTGTITIRNVNTSSNLVINVNDASQVSISGAVLTINPTANLGEVTNYAVLIGNGAIQDLNGNVFAGITNDSTWNFVTGVSMAGLAFYDDFEVASGSPNVDASGSAGNTSKLTGPKWVRASVAFGATNHGLVDESSGQFTDPGGEQAYAFRYTNTGITTAQGLIGSLTAGKSYRVSFNVVGDGATSGGPYSVGLVTFAPGASRNDVSGMGNGTSRVLATRSGTYSGTAYQLVSFEYISDGLADAAVQGHDVAIRLDGASTSAIFDNVQITINDAVIDVTAPTLASADIVDNQGGGPIEYGTPVTYTVTFSEDMDAATVSAADFANAGTSAVTFGAITEVVPGVFSVQVTPTNPGSLVLSVAAGAVIKDVTGNSLVTTSAITDNTTITVVSPPDLAAPTLVSVNPTNGAVDVTVSSNMVATFSESIAKGTGSITLKNLTDATDTIIDVTSSEITVSGSTLTINPTNNMVSGKSYAVQITAGAIKDLAGNNFAGITNNTTWAFTTEVLPYVWSQTAGGAQAWTTATNWLGGSVPDPIAGDTVDFSAANIAANTTLTLGADRTARLWKFGDTSGTQTWTVNAGNTMTLAGVTPTIQASTSTTLSNVVAGTAGILKTGSNTLNLANTANTFSGGVVVDQGSLTVNTDGSLGGSGGIVFNAAGSLTVSTSGHTLNRSLALNTSGQVNISMGGTATIAGAVTGTGGIIAPTTLTLGSTANTFTGPITMGSGFSGVTLTANSLGDGGLVYLGSQDNYGSSTFIYGTGATAPMVLNQRQFVLGGQGRSGTFDYSAQIKNNNANTANTVTINSDMIIGGVANVNNRRLVLSGTNTGENKFTGLLGDGVGALASEITSLAKFETGTWAVGGASTFTGPVTIKAGRLVTNHVADAGLASPLGASNDSLGMGLLLYGGTLQYAPVNGAGATGHATNRNLLIAASSTIDASGSGALQFTKTGDLSPDLSAQTITTTSGSAAVTVASTAGLAEGMTVRYNGGASSGVIGSINSATQYSLTANAAAAGTFGDATYGYPAARTLTLSGNSTASNSIAGSLRNSTASGTGVLSLTKSGVGTWVLNGANTYTGVTTVNDGTLLINGNSAPATGAVAVNNSATLGGGGTIGGTVTVAASAKLAPGNTVGLLTINSGLNISGLAGGAGTLNYDLAAIGASDRIAVGGTLTIGTAQLGFEDFIFTNAGGLNNGTYTLVSYATLSGTMKTGAALTGPVGNGSGTLQISGNSIQLVVSGVTVPDTTPPILAASDIVDSVSGATIQTETVVTYTVTFSEDINEATVTAADFGNSGSSSITIGTITEINPGVFTLQVTPSSAGTLQLKVNAGAVISDVAGNALNTASEIADNTTITVNAAPAWADNPVNETDATEDGVYAATLSDNATDANGDLLNFAKINGPAWLDVAADGALSGTPSNSDVGANSFTVSVSDGIAPAVEATLEIEVINTNDAPVFAANPITGADATEDAAYSGSIAGTASDVDAGATLVYAKVSGPAWLGIAANGDLSGTPSDSDVGANSFTVSVSDGIAPAVETILEITVNNTNDAPVFATNPIIGADATEDASYVATLAGSANDDDENELTYAKVSGPAWLSVAANGSLSGTPVNGDVGANSFTVSVSDGIAPAVEATLEIEVINTNDPPIFAANPIIGADATEDASHVATLAGSANDDDEDALTYAKVSGPAWLIVTADGSLSGTPENGDVGANSFTVSVSDGIAPAVEATLEIEVINTNDAPVFAANPVIGADATEDAAYNGSLASSASDVDAGATLTYTKVGGPAWLSVAADGSLSGTPANSNVGSNNFTVSVSDGIADPVEATLEITVINTNDTPVFAANPISAGNATEDSAYSGSIAGSASDVDADATLLYAKVSGPAWLDVASNGDLSGTPSNSDVGANVFTVSISDGIAPAVEATLEIEVINTNDAPVWAANPVIGADATEDAAYNGTLAGSATDVDAGATLTYAKVGGPAWLAVSSDGTLSGTPANGDAGPNSFTVSVSDGIAPAVETIVEINVINTNDAPVFAANPISAPGATENAAYNGTLAGSASDVDAGATLTYAKVSGPAWLNVSADGTLSGTPGISAVGANRFIVSVSDGIAAPQEAALDIVVSEAPPVLVFADNFEPGANSFGGTTSDVTTYTVANTSQVANTALWVRATSGFGGNRNGLVDESENSGANFTDPAGTQAYGFRYTNSGVTTAAGKIGSLATGTVIHVSFDVVRDGWNAGRAYEALLVLFDSGAARSSVENGVNNTAALLARANGSAPTNGSYQRINLSYVVGNPVVDNNGAASGVSTAFLSSLLGKDIALRFDGATDSANIDNVEITIDSSSTATPASVPNITGLAEANAASAILAANLVSGVVTEQHSVTVAEGNVISQNPTAGTQLAGGSAVDYVISLGLPMVTVPNVVGLTQSAAETSITAASLTVGDITEAYSDTVPTGDVISQGLTPAFSVPYGSQVDLVVSLGLDFTPKLTRTTVNAVGNTAWTSVDLGRAYHSPVIIATPIYPNATLPPVVTRITNVTSTGFDVKIERTDGLTDPVSIDVSIVAVDEGVYTQAEHGVTMEAVKFTSVLTSRKGSWVAEACGYQNTYVNPVVVGQVMSANDARWSVFWSMGVSTANPADAANLNVGKHVGEDTVTTRAGETIGYIVIEAGSGTIDGVAYEAGLGANTVQGFGDSTTPYAYTLSGNLGSASSAVVSIAGMHDDDGAWAALSGDPALTTTAIGLHACEDTLGDAEQSHATEQIGYIVFE